MQRIPAKKITIFTSEGRRKHHRPEYEVVLEELQRHGICGASVTKGIAGFGRSRVVDTIKIEILSYNLPIVIEATDTVEKMDRVIPVIASLIDGGVVEVTATEIVVRSRDTTTT